MLESWFDYVDICEDVCMTMCVQVIFGDGVEAWMIYFWFSDEVIMRLLIVSCVDDLRFNMFCWLTKNDCNDDSLGNEYVYPYVMF